jgi:hypothetical protein
MRHSFIIPATAIVLGFLQFAPVLADKMSPERMSYGRRLPGLNAMTSCRVPLFNICQGCNVTIRMRVPQNGVCPMNLRSKGPFAGQEILVHPQNGIYGSANKTETAYRPKSGFLGQDHFEARLFFEDGSGKQTTMTVKVDVFVVPSL